MLVPYYLAVSILVMYKGACSHNVVLSLVFLEVLDGLVILLEVECAESGVQVNGLSGLVAVL